MEKLTVLLVDDQNMHLYWLSSHLKKKGFSVLTAASGDRAMTILNMQPVDVIVSDHYMPEMDGIQLLTEIRKQFDIPFIILTGEGSIDAAVQAMKLGADDYLTKTCDIEELCLRIQKVVRSRTILKEYKELREHQVLIRGFHNIITNSPKMRRLVEEARRIAQIPYAPVAIYGESGTGKELLARAIHCASGCMENRFIGVNLAGIPETLLESELFGHVKGAFTGADKDREGKIHQAQKGTLLLDEIGDMPYDLQAKLLRILEERTYEKIGSNQPIKIDARIIVSTNHNLEELVKTGRFRRDLYHRIHTYPLIIPPLRERPEDIPLLTAHFMERFRQDFGKSIPKLSSESSYLLQRYSWPGNVRELKNCIERAIILADDLITPEHLMLNQHSVSNESDHCTDDGENIRIQLTIEKNRFSLEAIKDKILDMVLAKCSYNKVRAANLLKINRKMFYRNSIKR